MSFDSQFDSRQTRRLLLAGTVALPKPFPCTAVVRFEKGSITLACGESPLEEWFVVIRERGDLARATTHRVRASDVVALCFPGDMRKNGKSQPAAVEDSVEPCGCSVDRLDTGCWVLQDEVSRKGVKARLGVDLASPKSCEQAIVFVRKHAPVYTVTELAHTALAVPGPKTVEWPVMCSSCC